MRRSLLAVLAVTLTAISGCATTSSDPVDHDLAAGLRLLHNSLVNDHDHTDPALHPLVEWNIHQVFETNLPTDGAALSPPSEFQIRGHYAYVSVFHPSAGMVILDIAGPTHLVQVGRFDTGTAYVNDVEVSKDGHWAFLPTSPIETRENNPAGEGTPEAGDYGIQVVDVSNVTKPTLASLWYSPDPDPTRFQIPPSTDPRADLNRLRGTAGMGYHRLDIEEIQGQLYVAAAPLGFPRLDILRFVAAPVPHLEQVSFYISDDAMDPTLDRTSNPHGYGIHDVTFDPDPLQGFPLVAISHWRSGAHFLDLSDPANPKYLGRWNDFRYPEGNVHNVEFTAVEGHRMAVTVPEYPMGSDQQGSIEFVDITEFSHPVNHGNWTLPGLYPHHGADPGTGNHVFSTDRVTLRDGYVYDSHFHAGLIVLDASTWAKAAAPQMVGFILPKGETRVPYATIAGNPYIYDAIPDGDHVYFADLTGGFHSATIPSEWRTPDSKWISGD